MPEITKVYIIGNRAHSGKTLLAAYLADALQCELDSPEHADTPEFYSWCVQLAKAGWFYTPRIVAVTEIKVRLIRRANLRDIQRQLITYNRDENPFLEIIIVQPDHRLMDEAEYRIARALADIGLPAYYFSKWDVDTPLSTIKTPMKVYDYPPQEVGDPSLTTWVSRDDLASGVLPTRTFPIQAMVPITLSHSLVMLNYNFPSKLDGTHRVGVNYTVRYTTDKLPAASIVVRLLTIEGEWGVLIITGGYGTQAYAFKREYVYNLMAYCAAVNGDTIVVPDLESPEMLFKKIGDALLGHLAESNKTRCVNRMDALTAGDNK